MSTYFLHCTDGVDMVLDRIGTEVANGEDLRRVAFGSALQLMRSLPKHHGWTDWIVAAHDEEGFQVETVRFPDERVFEALLYQYGGTGIRDTHRPIYVLRPANEAFLC